jgi:hypothetical protein
LASALFSLGGLPGEHSGGTGLWGGRHQALIEYRSTRCCRSTTAYESDQLDKAIEAGKEKVDYDVFEAATRLDAAGRGAAAALKSSALSEAGCSDLDVNLSANPDDDGYAAHLIGEPEGSEGAQLVIVGALYRLLEIPQVTGGSKDIGISIWVVARGCPPSRRGFFEDFRVTCFPSRELCRPGGGL